MKIKRYKKIRKVSTNERCGAQRQIRRRGAAAATQTSEQQSATHTTGRRTRCCGGGNGTVPGMLAHDALERGAHFCALRPRPCSLLLPPLSRSCTRTRSRITSRRPSKSLVSSRSSTRRRGERGDTPVEQQLDASDLRGVRSPARLWLTPAVVLLCCACGVCQWMASSCSLLWAARSC